MASYQAIKSKIEALEKAAQVALKKEAASVIKKIQSLMSKYGITVADLRTKATNQEKVARKKPGRKSKTAAKYRNPATGQTWSGRGKPPTWMVGPRKKGTADQFLIGHAGTAKAPAPKLRKAAAKKVAKSTAAKKASQRKSSKAAGPKKVSTLAKPRKAAPKNRR